MFWCFPQNQSIHVLDLHTGVAGGFLYNVPCTDLALHSQQDKLYWSNAHGHPVRSVDLSAEAGASSSEAQQVVMVSI